MNDKSFDFEALPDAAAVPGPKLSARAAATADAPYLDGLNEAQRKAVEALDGPVLILAGAGTGKTKVLTTRLAHLLHTNKAWPNQILAVTFTNKAAREMKERIGQMIGGMIEGMQWLGTFHSICVRMLRYHAELVGLKKDFSILDTDDQIRLIKQLIRAEGIDEKRWPARLFAAYLDGWKNRGLAPDKVPKEEGQSFAEGKGLSLYKAYQARLKALNAVDFGDLLLETVRLLQENPDVAQAFQQRFKYILVDEYQDSNVVQYLWLRLLAQGSNNICCVGDDDQSIYGWRGAEVDNILRFEKTFPGAKLIRLERNYRSTPHILRAASQLIAQNQSRLGKTLWTEEKQGEKLALCGVWDGEEEARVICEKIENLQRDKHRLSEIAILVRTGAQMREFEDRFIALNLPYRVIGGPRFYERMEIRDALAYLKIIAQPDHDLAFERIFNTPKRGLGDASLQTIRLHSRAQNCSLYRAALALLETDDLGTRVKKALGPLMQKLERWRGLIDDLPHPELAGIVLDESGYTEMWQKDMSISAAGRLENLQEMINAMEDFESLHEFLEHISLVMDSDALDTTDKINLMTLHSAKGLEFDTVFLPGWEEGIFPHQRSLDEEGLAGLEEERRLAYVGITRARHRVFISFAANRRVHNMWQNALPSRFIDELPPDDVVIDAGNGLYQDPAAGRFGRAQSLPSAGADASDRADDFNPGERVFHQKFGYGKIIEIDGNKLHIGFEKAGEKKVMASFVVLA